jgi:hypothetical protein
MKIKKIMRMLGEGVARVDETEEGSSLGILPPPCSYMVCICESSCPLSCVFVVIISRAHFRY